MFRRDLNKNYFAFSYFNNSELTSDCLEGVRGNTSPWASGACCSWTPLPMPAAYSRLCPSALMYSPPGEAATLSSWALQRERGQEGRGHFLGRIKWQAQDLLCNTVVGMNKQLTLSHFHGYSFSVFTEHSPPANHKPANLSGQIHNYCIYWHLMLEHL